MDFIGFVDERDHMRFKTLDISLMSFVFFQDFITQKGNGGLAMGWGSMIAFGLPPEKMLALVTRLILFQWRHEWFPPSSKPYSLDIRLIPLGFFPHSLWDQFVFLGSQLSSLKSDEIYCMRVFPFLLVLFYFLRKLDLTFWQSWPLKVVKEAAQQRGSSCFEILADSRCHSGWLGKARWARRAAGQRHPGWQFTADLDGALKKYWKNMRNRYAAGAIAKYGMLCRNGTVFAQGKRYKKVVKAEMSGELQSIGDDWQELVTRLQSELHTNLSRYSHIFPSEVLVKARACMRMPSVRCSFLSFSRFLLQRDTRKSWSPQQNWS